MLDLLTLSNLLHDVGIILGVGGATSAFLISRKIEKNPKDAQLLSSLLATFSKLIFIGLLLLIISGIALTFYVKLPINKTLLIIKHILVAFILFNGIYLGLSLKKAKDFKARLKLKILGIINLVLWWAVTILSVFM